MTTKNGASGGTTIWLAGTLACLLGCMAVSALLVKHHAGVPSRMVLAFCGEGGGGREQVNRSPVAEVAGIPLALLGFCTYGLLAALVVVGLPGLSSRLGKVIVLLLLFATCVHVALLGYSVLSLGTVCPLCVTTGGLTAAAFVMSLIAKRRAGDAPPARSLRAVALSCALLAVVASTGWLVAHTRAQAEAAAASREDANTALVAAWRAFQREYVGAEPATIETAASPAWGSQQLFVDLVVFGDFLCSHCRDIDERLAAFAEEHAESVRLVFKHFPLDQSCNPSVAEQYHPGACHLAVAAECARRQGAFWPYSAWLFANLEHWQGLGISREDLGTIAATNGLDTATFQACLVSPEPLAAIQADIAEGTRLGVTVAPAIFIDGRQINSLPVWEFLEELLNHAQATAAKSGSAPPPPLQPPGLQAPKHTLR